VPAAVSDKLAITAAFDSLATFLKAANASAVESVLAEQGITLAELPGFTYEQLGEFIALAGPRKRIELLAAKYRAA
jgi:hypothetical protein